MVTLVWPPEISARVKWPPPTCGAVVWPPPVCAKITLLLGGLAPVEPTGYMPVLVDGIWIDAAVWDDGQLWNDGVVVSGYMPVLVDGIWIDAAVWADGKLWNDGTVVITEYYVSDGAGGSIPMFDIGGAGLFFGVN